MYNTYVHITEIHNIVYNTCVHITGYHCYLETGRLTGRQEASLEVTELRMHRLAMGVTRKDRIKTEEKQVCK